MTRWWAQRLRSRRRGAFALLLAIALHLFAALWLFPTRPTKPQRITLEILERKHPPWPPVEPPARPTPPAPTARVAHKAKRGTPAPPAAPGETAPPSTPAPLASEERPLPAAPLPDEASPTPDGLKGINLFEPGALHAHGGTPPGKGGTGGPEGGSGDDDNNPAAERARVSQRIEKDINEERAADRVGVGLVDPYFRELARNTNGEWAPRPETAGDTNDPGALQDLQSLIRRWGAIGKAWARTGKPAGQQGVAPENAVRPVPRNPYDQQYDPDLAEFRAHWDTGKGLWVGGLLVLELSQNHEGQPLGIRMIRSSGNKELDASARQAIILAAKQRLAPAHGLGLGGDLILSLWKMEARVVPPSCSYIPDPVGRPADHRDEPTPVECGNNMDLSAKGVVLQAPQLSTPLGTLSTDPRIKVITHVELLAVYGGETGPVPPASR